jgi:hypothetical protein
VLLLLSLEIGLVGDTSAVGDTIIGAGMLIGGGVGVNSWA